MLQFKQHIVKGRCAVKFCNNKTKVPVCSSCRCKETRAKDPVRYAFINLKNNAKRRGILFTLTLDQFREWCVKVNYIGLKGRSKESYTVDRKYEDIGYHADNIQIMKNIDNVKKYISYDWRNKTVSITTYQQSHEPAEDLPF